MEGHEPTHVFDAASYAGVAVGHALHVRADVLAIGVLPEQHDTAQVVPPPEL